MSSFNTRATSLKTKASVGARAADVLKHCEKLEKQQTYLKTLLTEANDTDMYNHVLDSHLYAIANMIPNFKMGLGGFGVTKPVKTTLVDPITDKVNILRDFIRHSTTLGMSNYTFPEKRQLDTERDERMRVQQAQYDRSVVQKLEDMARAKAQQIVQGASPVTRSYDTPVTRSYDTPVTRSYDTPVTRSYDTPPAAPQFGEPAAAPQFGAQPSRFPQFGASPVQASPAFAGFTSNGAPTYTGLSQTSCSVPRQPTVTSGPPPTPVKHPRFASTPKSKKQAVTSVTEKMSNITTDTPKQ